MSKQIQEVRTKLVGSDTGGGFGGGFGGFGTLRGRVTSLSGEIGRSQTPPTAIQTARVDEYFKDLNNVVTRVNTLITTTVPNLYKELSENNIQPNLGEPIKLVTRN